MRVLQFIACMIAHHGVKHAIIRYIMIIIRDINPWASISHASSYVIPIRGHPFPVHRDAPLSIYGNTWLSRAFLFSFPKKMVYSLYKHSYRRMTSTGECGAPSPTPKEQIVRCPRPMNLSGQPNGIPTTLWRASRHRRSNLLPAGQLSGQRTELRGT